MSTYTDEDYDYEDDFDGYDAEDFEDDRREAMAEDAFLDFYMESRLMGEM